MVGAYNAYGKKFDAAQIGSGWSDHGTTKV